jgi:hypothetical protein
MIWNKIKFVIIFCFLGVLIGSVFLMVSFYLKNNRTTEDASKKIIEVSNNKINRIISYVLADKNEIEELANSDGTKKFLKESLISNENIVKIDVDEKIEIIYREVTNYVINHPEKTSVDLQNDSVFQKIAVQTIGQNGYSLVENYKNQIMVFDKDKKLTGTGYENLKNELIEFNKIQEESSNTPDISGFYDWKEPDGVIKRKYVRLLRIAPKTADAVNLILVATGYIDDYKTIKNVFNKNPPVYEKTIAGSEFDNLVLINPDGYLIYGINNEQNLGINLNWPIYKDLELTKTFFKIKNENKIIFSDAYVDDYGDIYPEFLGISAVYDQGKLLGYLVVSKKMSAIFKITKDVKNLGETGESYLINRNQKLLISPLRHYNFDILIQNINTDNANYCFSNEAKIGNSLINYNNEIILGTNGLIPETPWCLLTEIRKNEVLNISFVREWIISLIIFLFFSLIGVLVTIRKKTELIVNEKIKKISKIKNFFIKLKIRYMVLFSLIFTTSYFFFITSFFQGWKKAAFYNDVAYLFTATVLIVLFFYGFRLKNNLAEKLIILGSFMAFLDKLIQIILKEYNNQFGIISTYFWLSGIIIGFIGLFLIFYGFKKELNL